MAPIYAYEWLTPDQKYEKLLAEVAEMKAKFRKLAEEAAKEGNTAKAAHWGAQVRKLEEAEKLEAAERETKRLEAERPARIERLHAEANELLKRQVELEEAKAAAMEAKGNAGDTRQGRTRGRRKVATPKSVAEKLAELQAKYSDASKKSLYTRVGKELGISARTVEKRLAEEREATQRDGSPVTIAAALAADLRINRKR